jgi:hypothetical protein
MTIRRTRERGRSVRNEQADLIIGTRENPDNRPKSCMLLALKPGVDGPSRLFRALAQDKARDLHLSLEENRKVS